MGLWARYLHWRRTAKHPGFTWEGTIYLVLVCAAISFGIGIPLRDSWWWWLSPAVTSFSAGWLSWPIEGWVHRRRERRSSIA